MADNTITTQGNEVTYEPWTDGYAVGFKVTHTPTGTVEYIYLNPSNNEDNSDVPNVFIYQGTEGDPAFDSAFHHYTVLEDVKGGWITYRCTCGHFEAEHGPNGCAGCDNGGRDEADICHKYVADLNWPEGA